MKHITKVVDHGLEIASKGYSSIAKDIPEISWDTALQGMATGDVIMHHGTGTNSTMMQQGMKCYYSHTAMLIKNPPADIMTQYNVPEQCPTGLYIWEVTAQVNGTRIVPWLKWLKAEVARNGDGYILVWRKLVGLDHQREARLWYEIRRLRDLPYEQSKSEMIKALFHKNKDENMDSAFCSEMVAAAYKQCGLLSPSINASNQTTVDFSAYFGKYDIGRDLLDGAHLEKEVRVNLAPIR